MKTDIQIAQEATMLPITEIAAKIDLSPDDLEMYGKYKAKLSDECMARLEKEKMENWYWLLPSIQHLREKVRQRPALV